MESPASDATATGVYAKANASRFHFKSGSKRPSKRHSREEHREGPDERASKRCRVAKDSRRRRKQTHDVLDKDQHPTCTRDGEYYDPDHRFRESLLDHVDEAGANSSSACPDDAFRESLFDALADDEGAAYWEGVYGQPVHVYPDVKPGPDGKLERMDEEEYADYVRTKMWEKSHQHILEEREAREKARRRKREERQHRDEDIEHEEAARETIRQRMEESLRRGEERKKAKEAEAAWDNYCKKWSDLKNAHNIAQESESNVRELIPWPVVSGKAKHVSKEDIERFLRASKAWKEHPLAMLKVERVRWHPDKMQQRFGQHIDTDTMKSVTAVFQVIDRLWNDQR